MTSEIRANTLKNRVGLGTVSFTNTGPIVSGIVTANSFSGPLITTSIDLNGDLDVDGHTNLDNVSIAGVSTFSDNVSFTTANGNGIIISKSSNYMAFGNSVTQYFGGTSMWLQHNGSTGYLHNVTGGLYIRNEDSSGGNIYIQGKSGEHSIVCNYDSDVQLYYDGGIVAQTTQHGFQITNGALDLNNTGGSGASIRCQSVGPFYVGAAAQGDLVLYCQDNTNNSVILQANTGEKYVECNMGGSVDLYHHGNKRLETSSVGVSIPQDLDVDGHTNLDNLSVAGVSTFTGAITGHDYRSGVGGNTLYLTSADDWRFRTTGGSEKVRIKSDGNVGVGTDNPTNKLSVCNGGIKVFGAATPNINFSPTDGNSGNADISFDASDLKIISNSSSANVRIGAYSKLTHFVIRPNGRIGVGTDSPSNSSLLHLYSTTFDPYLRIGSGTRDCGITLHPNSAFNVLRSDAANRLYVNAGAESIRFSVGGDTSTYEKLRIESSGDIIFKNNGGDNRIERDTTSGGPYLLFHNRGTGTTDNSGVYNMGGISAAGYRDVANPGIVGSIQFERQPTSGGASSGCDIVFRTGFNGTTSHTNHSVKLRLNYAGHLLPGANNQYDLGSTAAGWRNVYMNDLNLSNMKGNTNDVDGTQGSWTIQEGENDLFIINRLNGKKFKIKMEEIS